MMKLPPWGYVLLGMLLATTWTSLVRRSSFEDCRVSLLSVSSTNPTSVDQAQPVSAKKSQLQSHGSRILVLQGDTRVFPSVSRRVRDIRELDEHPDNEERTEVGRGAPVRQSIKRYEDEEPHVAYWGFGGAINMVYADHFGYDYHWDEDAEDIVKKSQRSNFFYKPLALRKYYSYYDYVIWVDSDAWISQDMDMFDFLAVVAAERLGLTVSSVLNAYYCALERRGHTVHLSLDPRNKCRLEYISTQPVTTAVPATPPSSVGAVPPKSTLSSLGSLMGMGSKSTPLSGPVAISPGAPLTATPSGDRHMGAYTEERYREDGWVVVPTSVHKYSTHADHQDDMAQFLQPVYVDWAVVDRLDTKRLDPLAVLFSPDWAFVLSREHPINEHDTLNAGCMIVRNTDRTGALLQEWWDAPDKVPELKPFVYAWSGDQRVFNKAIWDKYGPPLVVDIPVNFFLVAEGFWIKHVAGAWPADRDENMPGALAVAVWAMLGKPFYERRKLVQELKNQQASRVNLALLKPTRQSSTLRWNNPNGEASLAVDGCTDGDVGGHSCTHTNEEMNPWWQVDLQSAQPIYEVWLWNRAIFMERLKGVNVYASNRQYKLVGSTAKPEELITCGAKVDFNYPDAWTPIVIACPRDTVARYVIVTLPRKDYLTLCEVQVFSKPGPMRPINSS